MHKSKLTLAQIALFGMLGAMTFGAKVAMSGLPNIEPVSLFVMVFAVVFGWKCLYPIYVYVVMEFLIFPGGFWNINYLYVWLILAVVAIFLRKYRHPLCWALISGTFGMAFGLLCAPVYAFVGGGGWNYAWRWWLAGLPYDIPHAVGNFVIALLLFVPLRQLMEKLYAKMQ